MYSSLGLHILYNVHRLNTHLSAMNRLSV